MVVDFRSELTYYGAIMNSPYVDPELVIVFDSNQESEAMVVRGLLTSAGIDSVLLSREAAQDVLPGVGGVVVKVNAAQADEARQVIAESTQIFTKEDDELQNESAAEPGGE
jgi:Putative prokaryotic signal transducing protein